MQNQNKSISITPVQLHSGEYVASYEKKPLKRLSRLKKFLDLKKDYLVVDFACGNAMLLEVLQDSIKEYHGVDFSSDMIAAAKKRAEKLSFQNAYFYLEDIINFSENNKAKFDAAFAIDFSEHVDDKTWIEILRAIKCTLKPRGLLYLHTPNKNYFLEILKEIGVLPQFPEHIAVRTPEHNLQMLIDSGFVSVNLKYLSHYEWRQKPFAFLGMLPGIGKYFKARLLIMAKK